MTALGRDANPRLRGATSDRRCASFLQGAAEVRYALQLRGMAWDYRRHLPFEVFRSTVLAPPG